MSSKRVTSKPCSVGIGALALGITLVVAGPARAERPATANVIQLGLGFRYGFELEPGDANPWGTGLGIDGGYTLESGVYLGGNFDYFFGDDSGNIWQLMAEGGYDIGLDRRFVLRPKAGAGIASLLNGGSSTHFAAAPGLAFLYIGPSISFSIDLRFDMIFVEGDIAKALLLAAGIGF